MDDTAGLAPEGVVESEKMYCMTSALFPVNEGCNGVPENLVKPTWYILGCLKSMLWTVVSFLWGNVGTYGSAVWPLCLMTSPSFPLSLHLCISTVLGPCVIIVITI